MRIRRAIAIAATACPMLLHAQNNDSLHVGDRVRVRVAATHGNTNLFVGNVAVISPETLVVDIPGGKGSIILPRAAIAEVALSNGRESRFTNAKYVLFLVPAVLTVAATPMHYVGPNANRDRNQRYTLLGLLSLPLAGVFFIKPPEAWRPVYSWLDPRPPR